MEELKEFIEEFYNYTTEISVTESELFSHYDFLENKMRYKENGAGYDDYKNQALKDILFDFIFRPEEIKSQLENDFETYGDESQEYREINNMYNKCKKFIDIYVEYLERGDGI